MWDGWAYDIDWLRLFIVIDCPAHVCMHLGQGLVIDLSVCLSVCCATLNLSWRYSSSEPGPEISTQRSDCLSFVFVSLLLTLGFLGFRGNYRKGSSYRCFGSLEREGLDGNEVASKLDYIDVVHILRNCMGNPSCNLLHRRFRFVLHLLLVCRNYMCWERRLLLTIWNYYKICIE